VLDLFAGGGGFSLGFHWAGFHTAVAMEIKLNALETLKANFSHLGTRVLEADLAHYSPQKLKATLEFHDEPTHFDLIIGGPPCQGWSMVGRGKIRALAEETGRPCEKRDPRNQLTKRFLQYVRYFQPKVAVMENVTGMLSHGGKNVAELVAAGLTETGYNVTWQRINTSEFGLPQVRERLFFVGVRKDLKIAFKFPEAKKNNGSRNFPALTVRDAIADLPKVSHGAKELIRPYSAPANISAYAKQMRLGAAPDLVFDHICRTHNSQDLEAFRLLRQGGWYRELPDRLKRYRDDIFEDKYKKLHWGRPSGCVTAHLSKDCYTHIHPSQPRTITVREAARLQSFPDCFYLGGSMSAKFELLGNAVPPLIAFILAREIKKQVILDSQVTKKSRKRVKDLGVEL
jgi:DNA (cytosine-5)-methyltransferase 1